MGEIIKLNADDFAVIECPHEIWSEGGPAPGRIEVRHGLLLVCDQCFDMALQTMLEQVLEYGTISSIKNTSAIIALRDAARARLMKHEEWRRALTSVDWNPGPIYEDETEPA